MENKYKCLVVDDECPAHLVIKSHIQRTDNLVFTESVFNGKDAIQKLSTQAYDIVFMDIDMPLFSGIEVLQTLSVRPATIITTAYIDFAFDAYQLEAVDYLLKPISYPRFAKAIEKAMAFLELKSKNTSSIKSISFKVDGYMQEYELENISHFQSIGNYIRIVFNKSQKPVLIYDSLKNLVDILPAEKFIQIHKSYIVNKSNIKSLEKESLELISTEKLPVGRKFELLAQLAIKNK